MAALAAEAADSIRPSIGVGQMLKLCQDAQCGEAAESEQDARIRDSTKVPSTEVFQPG